MKMIRFIMISTLILGSFSFASEEKPMEKHGPCGKVNLSDDQKAKMKEAMFDFRESKIDLKAQVSKAKLKYQRLIANPDTDYKAAQAAAQELSDSISKMISAKQAFKTKVAFEILKPKQREPAMQCEAHMKHRWGHKDHS